MFFTGEGQQVGAKFLSWITNLADEAVIFYSNLGVYFNLAPGTTDEEHHLTTDQALYDHFVLRQTILPRPSCPSGSVPAGNWFREGSHPGFIFIIHD